MANQKEVLGYVVSEPTVGKLFPIMGLMEKNPQEFQMKLAGLCISKDGKVLGTKGVEELGIATYMQLMVEVMDVSGFSK